MAVGEVEGGDDDSEVADDEAQEDDEVAAAAAEVVVVPVVVVPVVVAAVPPVEEAAAAPLREEWRGSDEASLRTDRHSSAHSRSLSVKPYWRRRSIWILGTLVDVAPWSYALCGLKFEDESDSE